MGIILLYIYFSFCTTLFADATQLQNNLTPKDIYQKNYMIHENLNIQKEFYW